jgi:hypothetical protein
VRVPKRKSKTTATPNNGADVLLTVLSAGSVRQMAGEAVLEIERASARRRSEPFELAKWRVLVEYRTNLLKSIGYFAFNGPKHAKAVARARRKAAGNASDAQKSADKIRELYDVAEKQCIAALEKLDEDIRARPAKAMHPDRIIEAIREPKMRIAMLATQYYLREQQSDTAWESAAFALLTVTMAERSRKRVDALIAEARKWQRETGRSGALKTIARYVVAKLAKLPTDSKKLK